MSSIGSDRSNRVGDNYDSDDDIFSSSPISTPRLSLKTDDNGDFITSKQPAPQQVENSQNNISDGSSTHSPHTVSSIPVYRPTPNIYCPETVVRRSKNTASLFDRTVPSTTINTQTSTNDYPDDDREIDSDSETDVVEGWLASASLLPRSRLATARHADRNKPTKSLEATTTYRELTDNKFREKNNIPVSSKPMTIGRY